MENQTEVTKLNPVVGATAAATVVAKRRRAPSVKRAETKTKKEQDRGFPLPLLLTCTVTGKVNKYTSLNYIRKLVAKYGSVEEIRKNYISAEGRKQNK
jgi:hypothetical protein